MSDKKANAEKEKKRLAAENAARKKALKEQRRADSAKQKAELDKLKAKRRAELDAEKARVQKLKAEQRAIKAKARLEVYKKLRKKLSNSRNGFDYENFGFLPRVEICASGDPAAVAQKLADSGIKAVDFFVVGAKMRFKIRKKELRKAIALLDGICYNYEVGRSYGIGRAVSFWLARAGLCLGAIAAAGCAYLSYSYVWRIEISGNDKLAASVVERALAESGYTAMRKKRGIDCEAVAAAVNRLDGVADASADLRGTTLYVYVLEAENTQSNAVYTSYRSGYDATITRVIVRSGTALVKNGDVVAKDAVLADGNVYSTAGEVIAQGECDAEIYGNVSVVFTANIGPTSVEYRRTGESCKKTSYSMFGFSVGKTVCPYASYESEITSVKYDVLLPLTVTSYRYYETAPVEVECDIDELARSFAEQKIDEMRFEGDFTSSYTVGEGKAGLYTVHVFLSGETLISRGVR